jgi:hypothetical protein
MIFYLLSWSLLLRSELARLFPSYHAVSLAWGQKAYCKVFFTISILVLYMILMSEKMMSQTITDEFIYVSVQGNERNT